MTNEKITANEHQEGEKLKWEKVLWKRQPFPDNHTNLETFLSHLTVNGAGVPRRKYWQAVAGAASILHVSSCAVAISTVPWGLYHMSLKVIHQQISSCEDARRSDITLGTQPLGRGCQYGRCMGLLLPMHGDGPSAADCLRSCRLPLFRIFLLISVPLGYLLCFLLLPPGIASAGTSPGSPSLHRSAVGHSVPSGKPLSKDDTATSAVETVTCLAGIPALPYTGAAEGPPDDPSRVPPRSEGARIDGARARMQVLNPELDPKFFAIPLPSDRGAQPVEPGRVKDVGRETPEVFSSPGRVDPGEQGRVNNGPREPSLMAVDSKSSQTAGCRRVSGRTLRRVVRQYFLLTGGVFFLSPLLRTLAQTVSGDSVAAIGLALMLAHVYLYDYRSDLKDPAPKHRLQGNAVGDGAAAKAAGPPQLRLQGALSLSAACLSVVMAASQMPSELDVFAQVLFSFQLLIISPTMRRRLAQRAFAAYTAAGVLAALLAAALLSLFVSRLAAVCFLAAEVAIVLVAPAYFVSMQKFRSKINGPWDEAVPHIRLES